MPPLYSVNALLNATLPLDLTLAAYILLGCLLLRWIANILANHIPAILIHDWQQEVAVERDEDFPKPRPSLLKAAKETPFMLPLLRSIRSGAPIDALQATVDLAMLIGPLAIIWFAGGICAKSLMIATLVFLSAIATVIDKNHFLLPDVVTLPTVWLGLIASSLGLFTNANSAIWGACFGYSILWGVNVAYRKTTGEEGIGLGDAKWLAIPGAWFGPESAVHVLLIATILGIGYAAISDTRKIPFGPALSAATLAVGLIALTP